MSTFRTKVYIAPYVLEEMKWLAQQELPNECGGYVIEDEKGHQTLWGITNVHSNPAHNYAGSPQETLAANAYVYSDTSVLGRKVVCEWHTHPTTEAIPSEVDRYIYRNHDLLCIVSVANPDSPEVRLWNLDNEEVGITDG